ncbi:MAG: ABC transporter permease [Firmicutes bacterium]|nr:ABC transporter permease [Bacillota bacterium]
MAEILTLSFKSRRFVVGFVLFILVLGFAFVGPMIHDQDPTQAVGGLYNAPSVKAPLGTDNLGHDVLSQLMHGTKTSLLVGLIAGIVAIVIGVAVGSLAGYLGGIADEILMGLTNVFITIPPIVFLILLSVSVTNRSAIGMGVIIGMTGWPWTARAVRAQASSLRTRGHVDLARITGISTVEMVIKEILPYMFSYIFMAFILQLTGAIANEATLSMLGLGPSNVVSLGMMLHWALLWEAVRVGAWWAFVPPVIFLTVISFSLMLMNSGMDEIFNPRLRK